MILENPETLEVLKDTPDLESLTLRHFPKIASLEPLRALTKLRVLYLQTIPSWDASTRNLVVDSFEPLASLTHLEKIKIISVLPKAGRLEPLCRIPSLKHVTVNSSSNFYQLEDYAALSVALPNARESLKPARQFRRCNRCKNHLTLLLKGSRPRQKKDVCPACERAKLISHLERWNNAGGVPRYDRLDVITSEAFGELFAGETSAA